MSENIRVFNDKVKFIHYIYTFFGFFFFILFNLIQFVFFMPLFLLYSLLFDKRRKCFIYLTKFFLWVFHIVYAFERIHFDKNGLKGLKKGERRLYIVNHASQYDVAMIYLLPGPIKFLFKEKWSKLPVIGWMAKIAGNIVLKDESSAADSIVMFRNASELMDEGYPFMIFPEGTRSRDGKIGPFFHGAFKLATETKADIVPIIFDSWNVIRPGALLIRDTKVTLKALEPIKYDDYKHLNFIKISHLVRIKMIEGLINLRNSRREKEKHYYRKDPMFVEVDKEMEQELIELREYAVKRKIKLIDEMPPSAEIISEKKTTENILSN